MAEGNPWNSFTMELVFLKSLEFSPGLQGFVQNLGVQRAYRAEVKTVYSTNTESGSQLGSVHSIYIYAALFGRCRGKSPQYSDPGFGLDRGGLLATKKTRQNYGAVPVKRQSLFQL